MTTAPWHSTRATDRPVYHDDTGCLGGRAIALPYRRPGDGGRPQCEHCARSARQARPDPPMPSRGPAPRETDERRCPSCRSYRIIPVGHVDVTGGMMKETHRCDICTTAFLVVHTVIG